MKSGLQLLSLTALAGVILPCLLYFAGAISQTVVTASALGGTLIWFVVTPLWMGRELPPDADQVEI